MVIRWQTSRATPVVIAGAMLLTLGACARGRDAARVDSTWIVHLRRMEQALTKGDVRGATREWSAAYPLALQSGRWDRMVELGDAYLRFAQTPGERKLVELQAGDLYLAALMRAHRQGSLDGVLRTAAAFARLGDRERVAQALHLAGALATRDRHGDELLRVRAFREELAVRLRSPDSPDTINGL